VVQASRLPQGVQAGSPHDKGHMGNRRPYRDIDLPPPERTPGSLPALHGDVPRVVVLGEPPPYCGGSVCVFTAHSVIVCRPGDSGAWVMPMHCSEMTASPGTSKKPGPL